MMTEKALAIREMSLNDTMALGATLAESGYFSDAKQAAQAVVKILAGREIGFGPIASMTGIHIASGRVTLGANIMAAAVKRSGRYNYRIAKHDMESCEIVFFENGAEIGRSLFTIQDAKTANLTTGPNKHSWTKFRRNMLFARAMSNGVKWYCPDVFYGAPIYAPEELGAVIDGETGEIIIDEIIKEKPSTAITTTAMESEPDDPFGNHAFDPENPTFQSYDELYYRAIEHLGYSHMEHAKNALKKITNGDAGDLTHQGAWQLLKDHQAAKMADAEPEEKEN